MPASTTRVRMASLPRTPMLTTHWKARLHFQLAWSSFMADSGRGVPSERCGEPRRIRMSRSNPPSMVTISRIRGEVDVRYARWFRELISGSVAVQSSAAHKLVRLHSQMGKTRAVAATAAGTSSARILSTGSPSMGKTSGLDSNKTFIFAPWGTYPVQGPHHRSRPSHHATPRTVLTTPIIHHRKDAHACFPL